MTQLASKPTRGARNHRTLDDVQHIVLEDVSWDLYERLLKEVGDRPIRMTYDEGRLEIMSPLGEHESVKTFVGRMIEMLAFLMDIEVSSLGSTTYRKKRKKKGLEPDECYFFKNAVAVRGIREWDASKHPPPELVVEVDITSRSIEREPIYAALGVPEIWRWDGSRLECLHLAGGHYVIRKASLAFPFLKPSDLRRFIVRVPRKGENAMLHEFVAWIRKNGWIE